MAAGLRPEAAQIHRGQIGRQASGLARVVRRDGETSSGPSWRPTEENGPEPSDEPILTRVDGALASGSTSAAPTDATAANTAEAESEESGMNAGALVGAAAAVVVVVAGAFFLLRRRR